MRNLLFLALGLAIGIYIGAPRAQLSASVFGLSKHSESGYCEFNPGLGLNYYASDAFHLAAGRYLNSKCRWSNAIGGAYEPLKLVDFRFGTALLRLTGYRDKPVWALLPVGQYTIDKRYYVDFFAVKNRDLTVAGAALGIRF